VLRHVVCLTWVDDVAPAAVDAVVDGLRALPAQIPELRGYWVGTDRRLATGNADLAIVADFDDDAGWRAYQQHPAHIAVLTERIRPILAHRAAVQFDWDR